MSEEAPRPAPARHRILVVDDERQTVSAVKHLLRRKYKVLGATRAQEALELLDQEPVSVVLCDQRMPEMTGDAFFAEARRRHPNTIRILITAYADIQALVRSINNGHIFGYVAKPWSPEELEHMVARAVEHWDVSELNRRMTRELADANQLLQKANDELKAFTHVVAHDLKEPLRTIAAYTQFMRGDLEPPLQPEGLHYLDGIQRCAEHLFRLIDDLMRFTEIDHIERALEQAELRYVVSKALEMLEGAVRDTGAEVRVAETLPVVEGDAGRLVLLFQNLISNGLKFNQSAPPVIEVGAGPSEGDTVEVFVRDNGIGIHHDYQQQIFELFERLHARTEYPGTGAGLAIVRRIVELHGGEVAVESTPGNGSTFRLTLRRAGAAR